MLALDESLFKTDMTIRTYSDLWVNVFREAVKSNFSGSSMSGNFSLPIARALRAVDLTMLVHPSVQKIIEIHVFKWLQYNSENLIYILVQIVYVLKNRHKEVKELDIDIIVSNYEALENIALCANFLDSSFEPTKENILKWEGFQYLIMNKTIYSESRSEDETYEVFKEIFQDFSTQIKGLNKDKISEAVRLIRNIFADSVLDNGRIRVEAPETPTSEDVTQSIVGGTPKISENEKLIDK